MSIINYTLGAYDEKSSFGFNRFRVSDFVGRPMHGKLNRVCRQLSDRARCIVTSEHFAFGGPITNRRIFWLFFFSYLALC